MILKKINRRIPNHLYHNTNLESLVGIISNDELWLSNLYFQNDKQEYKIGLNLFREILRQKLKEYHKDEKTLIFLNSLVSAIKYLETSNVFILSFSEEPDLLSQWRGYADNGRGLRIELSFIEKIKSGNLLILPCIYSPDEQNEYVEYLFNSCIELFNNTVERGLTNKINFIGKEKQYSDAIQIAGSKFISTANVACAIIKNISFSEEKEWRLLNFKNQEVFFKTQTHFITPYIKMTFSNLKEILTDIMVCWSPEHAITHSSIQFLLDNKNYKSTTLSNSTIPFRL